MLLTAKFGDCCGASIIYGFPGSNSMAVPASREQIEKDFQSLSNREFNRREQNRAFVLAIVNKFQNEFMEEHFLKAGYKNLAVGYNQHHIITQPLHLYGLVREKPEWDNSGRY